MLEIVGRIRIWIQARALVVVVMMVGKKEQEKSRDS